MDVDGDVVDDGCDGEVVIGVVMGRERIVRKVAVGYGVVMMIFWKGRRRGSM